MSQSIALCSEGGKFSNTTERSGFSEGEKEKNISEPVLKNEATPSSYEELKKRHFKKETGITVSFTGNIKVEWISENCQRFLQLSGGGD